MSEYQKSAYPNNSSSQSSPVAREHMIQGPVKNTLLRRGIYPVYWETEAAEKSVGERFPQKNILRKQEKTNRRGEEIPRKATALHFLKNPYTTMHWLRTSLYTQHRTSFTHKRRCAHTYSVMFRQQRHMTTERVKNALESGKPKTSRLERCCRSKKSSRKKSNNTL